MSGSPLDLKTPAQGRARALASDYGLANHGITNPRCVYWNLPAEALYEELVFRGEGRIVRGGPVAVATGSHTSRAAQDKFIVREPSTEDRIWWGEYNRPIGSDTFELLLSRMLGFLQERDLFVQDVHACAQPEYRLPVRVVTEYAWHSLFARNMFLKPVGTVLENVVYDEVTRKVDLDDDSLTENTRASYPLDFIEHAVPSRTAGHPSTVLFLTCDAQGVLPPLARLTPDQALYHFVSGYTSKIAGTEAGLGAEPEIVFSTCFGAPFMVHHPWVYADLLARKLERHGSSCWLVNTGWVGGPFGIGKRISIEHTRTLLDGVLSGALSHAEFRVDPVFGFEVPMSCPGLPDEVLHPEHSWPSEEEYMARYRELAARYAGNFRKLGDECPPSLLAAGPRLEPAPVD